MNIHTNAYWFALGAHGDQLYGEFPYVDTHCESVVRTLIKFGFDTEEWINIGWLHDVIEDTNITRGNISSYFGDIVSSHVWAVSGMGNTRKERNADIHRKIVAFPSAAIVKTADRLSNLSSSQINKPKLYAMYLKENTEFSDMVSSYIPDIMKEALLSFD